MQLQPAPEAPSETRPIEAPVGGPDLGEERSRAAAPSEVGLAEELEGRTPTQVLPARPEAEDPLGDPFSDTFAPANSEPRGGPAPPEVDETEINAPLDPTRLPSPGSPPWEQHEAQLDPPPNEGLLAEGDLTVPPVGSGPEGTGGVRIILEDGTLAKPSLDPELEERLRYIVDNIVPPSDPPSQGRAT